MKANNYRFNMTPQEIDERINRLSKGKCMFMQKIFQQVGAEEKQILTNKTTTTMDLGFRVWDVKKSRFVDTGEIQFSFYGNTSVKVYPNEIQYGHIEDYEHDVLNGRFIVQQRTGVKDKNGREIYEGDIVLYLDFCSRYNDEEFVNKGVVERSDWGFAFSNRETTEMDDMDLSEIEVIGNIHENPELLNND